MAQVRVQPYLDLADWRSRVGDLYRLSRPDALALDLTAASPDMAIDFNVAYNPSCVYDARWACPLAPRENWLTVPVGAGEKLFP
jgi:uncharacterized protein (DUF1684 family)